MRWIVVCALVFAACHGTAGVHDASPWSARAGTVRSTALDALCRDVWEDRLARDPVQATRLGDPRRHGELVTPSPREREDAGRAAEAFLGRARALDLNGLEGEDRLTRACLIDELELAVAEAHLAVDTESWNLDLRGGPHNLFLSLAEVQPVGTPEERAAFVARWRRIPAYVDQCTSNLERGLAHGRVASRTAVDRTVEQLDRLLATVITESPLVAPATGGGRWIEYDGSVAFAEIARRELGDATRGDDLVLLNLHVGRPDFPTRTRLLIPAAKDTLEPAERGRFLFDVLTTVRDDIYPAFARYRDLIDGKIAPLARGDARPGVMHVDGGPEAYRVAIRRHTSLELSPEEIRDLGLAEVARVEHEIQGLGRKLFGTDSIAIIQEHLRASAELHFKTREDVEARAERTLARAVAAVPAAFSRLPRTPCEVVRVPEHEERDTTTGYYEQPSADGARSGRYFVNTFAPSTRPTFDAEALAFHESVPGHHLQIALAQELDGLPPVRRYAGNNAYVEGWALYSEKLADELGLYTSDLDRLGMLSFDAWRAARLVVDTGLHAFGWTREQAIRYLEEHTLLAESNAENEVDRYIAWPGQALGYKLGEQRILGLRRDAQRTLGTKFRLADFHAAVLEHGPLPLPVLENEVRDWIRAAAR
ncbi:MAG: DUF885 domain-containing protein [Planctomycetes bacterium]|nr:DUF885 domain-containing protein [Planctomycetota bacterium]